MLCTPSGRSQLGPGGRFRFSRFNINIKVMSEYQKSHTFFNSGRRKRRAQFIRFKHKHKSHVRVSKRSHFPTSDRRERPARFIRFRHKHKSHVRVSKSHTFTAVAFWRFSPECDRCRGPRTALWRKVRSAVPYSGRILGIFPRMRPL